MLAGTGVLLASFSSAIAAVQTYDFTFTSSGGMDATGTINVDNGVVQSGSINVTGIPVEASPSTLITASGSLIPGTGVANNHNGDDVSYDNLINFSTTPVLDGNGVAFGAGQYGANSYDTLIGLNGGDIYGNIPPYTYTLFVGEAELDANGNVLVTEYVYTDDSGTLTLVAVPEPTATTAYAGLSALGVVGLVGLRRKFSMI